MSEARIFTDGAARGNPGPAGAGGVILDGDGKELGSVCRYLGEMTNNQAEYHALLLALKEALRLKIGRVAVFCDSELMVRQILGQYKVKNEGLQPLFQEAIKLSKEFASFNINHVMRERNKAADKLANLAIDGQIV